MLRDSRHIAEAYTTVPSTPISVPNTITPGVKMTPTPVSQGNEETKKTVKDWLRLEPGLYPIDTVRKADHTAHVILQFIYSICTGPDAVSRVLKTLNKAYKQDKK